MQPVNLPKKRTLIKDRVGVVRTSTYNLPTDPNHIYGLKKNSTQEGTGEIISNWAAANPSEGKESIKSYVHSNVLAIKNGCVSAQAMRMYTDAHPNIRLKEVYQEGGLVGNANHEGPFGIHTQFADESMKDIIQAKYTNLSADDNDYPDTSNIMKMSSFPKPIATKASEVLAQARKDEKAKKAEIPRKFCMKKFQNVESKIKLPGGPSSHRAASSQGFRTTSNSEV